METHFTELQADFEAAWFDLRMRLTSGKTSLEEIATTVVAPKEATRLTDKAAAVGESINIHDRLSTEMPNDPAGAWRTFTDAVTTLAHDPDRSAGNQQGAYLALSYQRGYGAHVDAPMITSPR